MICEQTWCKAQAVRVLAKRRGRRVIESKRLCADCFERHMRKAMERGSEVEGEPIPSAVAA